MTPLEKGKHAYEHIQLVGEGKGGRGKEEGLRLYSRDHNYPSHAVVSQWRDAYEVFDKTGKLFTSLPSTVLYEISKADDSFWPNRT